MTAASFSHPAGASLRRIACVLALAACAGTVSAQDNPPPAPPDGAASGPGAGRPKGPPPEAIQACKGKAEGTSVSFTARDGRSLSGVCRLVDGQLAAMPQRGERPGG